jgi:hypothetical protein
MRICPGKAATESLVKSITDSFSTTSSVSSMRETRPIAHSVYCCEIPHPAGLEAVTPASMDELASPTG